MLTPLSARVYRVFLDLKLAADPGDKVPNDRPKSLLTVFQPSLSLGVSFFPVLVRVESVAVVPARGAFSKSPSDLPEIDIFCPLL